MDRSELRPAVTDIALNALVPLLLYEAAKHFGATELVALAIATSFPLLMSANDLIRRRTLNPVSVVVLLGIAANGIALYFGGSSRLLLLRESLFTAAFGVACLLSLLWPRPLMFYFGRHFRAGADPQKRQRFEAAWQLPRVRFAHRLITVVWGVTLLAEFGWKWLLINSVSAPWVLAIAPVGTGILTIAVVAWTFRYAKNLRESLGRTSGPTDEG